MDLPNFNALAQLLMQQPQLVAQRNPMQSKLMDPRGGTEGAVGYGGGSNRLVVAGKLKNGETVYGRPGDIHSDLANPFRPYAKTHNLDDIVEMGFAKAPGGKFMTREEAAKAVNQQTPLQG